MKIIKIANATYHKVESYLETLLSFYNNGGAKAKEDGLMIAFFQQLAVSLHYVKRLDEVLDQYLPEVPKTDSLENQVQFLRNLFREIYDVNHMVRRLLFDVSARDHHSQKNVISIYPNTVRHNYFRENVDNTVENIKEPMFRKHVPYLRELQERP